MKKNVSFDKNVEFPTMIGEIVELSLEHNLKFVDSFNIKGDLLLNGKYKLTEASRVEDDFNYNIPLEISLIEKIDINNSNIEIIDFYYEIINDNTMKCHVELEINGLEVLEEKEEVRECDGDKVVEEEEINDEEEIEDEDEEEKESINDSLFTNLDEEDTYGTFLVYIVRENESINSIIEKYNTNIEEIQKYNDIDNIGVGTKLIIPYINE